MLDHITIPPALKLPDEYLQGQRIHMRPPHLRDSEKWRTVREKNKRYLKAFEPRWADDALTHDYFKRQLKRQVQDWKNGRAQSFIIFHEESGAVIGGVNVNNIARGAAQFASLGYWIDQDHQGQGYMKEALALVIQYCFEELRLHRIHASCILKNKRSQKTLLSLGFVQEGLAEKYISIDGRWQDHYLYGLSIENWQG